MEEVENREEILEQPYPKLEEMLEMSKRGLDGKIALPEFQRSFVWANQDIKDILVSILNGYFVGTFLFLRRGDTFDFKIRYVEGVDKVNTKLPSKPEERNVDRVVLDGQQRLTALFYALYHPPDIKPKWAYYPYRYFVKIYEKLNGKDWDEDEVIYSISENDRVRNIEINIGSGIQKKYSFKEILEWAGGFENLLLKSEFKQYCYENGIIPFPFLRKREELDDWLDDYGYYLSEKKVLNEEIKKKKKAIKSIFNRWFAFKVPTLTLENRPFFEVAEIFERINRTGIALSVFALATAVFFEKDRNLRGWWEEYYNDDESVIGKFCKVDNESYPKYILQIMALLQGKDVTKKILINPKEFTPDRATWDKACKLLNNALKRLQDTQTGYGVIRPDLLPYKPIIVALAALLEHCKTKSDFRKVDVWYWGSVFTGRYTGSSDTAIGQDFKQVKKWLDEDAKSPDVVREAEMRIGDINLKTIDRGALYKAILNIIALKRAKDFFSGQFIDLIKLDDHHVFPKNSGIKLTNENSILNRTLIQDTTNKKISKKKPSEYLRVMKENLRTEEEVKAILETHLIGERGFKAMMNNYYDDFLNAREELIVKELKSRIEV